MITEHRFSVRLSAISVLTPAGINEHASIEKVGKIDSFKARKMIADRKNIKLMTRAVQLGVACISDAVSKVPHWSKIPPERRGIFVGASPQVGNENDLQYAIDHSYQSGEFSLQDFGAGGIGKIHPLWLIRGLTNNVLGFSSAHHNIQGCNMNYAMGEHGGWNAILEALYALKDNRVDIVVAGASDDLTGATKILDGPCSEGAAFLIFERGKDELLLNPSQLSDFVSPLGHIGAAKWPVAIALKHLAK
jgi:hypothetical protein